VEVVGEIWRRATSVQPAPAPVQVALTALVALVAVLQPSLWRYTRVLVTITHEGGHAVAALFAGRRLRGIRLHSDTSGLTVSSGKASGPGMVVMLLAGYLAPAVVGLVAVACVLSGHALGLLWIFVILLALMLLQIRNFYGFTVVIAGAVGLILISWYLPAQPQSLLAYLLTWILLVAAPKPVWELARQRRRGLAARSDADQLAGLTRTPAIVWVGVFALSNVVGLVLGAVLLIPALLELGRSLVADLSG
jgi:hypothetical protein